MDEMPTSETVMVFRFPNALDTIDMLSKL
jgi:hypothetical protein